MDDPFDKELKGQLPSPDEIAELLEGVE